MPHHGVTHPNKPEKVRIVFDATAEYDNKSLNGSLLLGPDLLNNIVAVILRFRQGTFAATSDIDNVSSNLCKAIRTRCIKICMENGQFREAKTLCYVCSAIWKERFTLHRQLHFKTYYKQ